MPYNIRIFVSFIKGKTIPIIKQSGISGKAGINGCNLESIGFLGLLKNGMFEGVKRLKNPKKLTFQ